MFRISLIVCVLLTLDVTAKYLNGLTKETMQEALKEALEEAKQDGIVSLDEKGRISWGEQVEPPEDMDEIQYVIDPRMKIWKDMADGVKQPPMPEDDSQEALQDEDDIHHPDIKVAFREPEQDLDEIYHKMWEQLAPLASKSRENVKDGHVRLETDELYGPAEDGFEDLKMVRLHLQPEEDLDHLYHKDVSAFQRSDAFPKAAVPNEYPAQRRYAVPEEDLDDIHHKQPLQ